MAKIFPSPDSEKACFFAPKTPGEKNFLAFAKEKLSNEWTVFHNLVYGNASEKDVYGEFDFLLYHEIFGLLAVEIKDGKIEYSFDTDEWTQNGHAFFSDPWKQAASRENYLRAVLSHQFETSVFAFGISHLVCFPDTNFDKNAFPQEIRSNTIFKNDFDEDFAGTFENFLKNSNDREKAKDAPIIPSDGVRYALESLYETAKTLFDDNGFDERKLLRLTAEQGKLLGEKARGVKRFRVRGGAGTGKTLIACEMAKRLAQEGKRVLLICHNLLLSKILKKATRALRLKLEAAAFDPLARGYLGIKLPQVDAMSPEERSRFFQQELPTRFAEFLKGTPKNFEKYDEIIVDEAQDFSALRWKAVEEMLSPDGGFVIFYDPDQNLFNDELSLPPLLADAPEFLLTKNCRNTIKIFEKIRESHGEAPMPMDGAPKGETVEVFSPKNDDEAVENLSNILNRLRKRNVPAEKSQSSARGATSQKRRSAQRKISAECPSFQSKNFARQIPNSRKTPFATALA